MNPATNPNGAILPPKLRLAISDGTYYVNAIYECKDSTPEVSKGSILKITKAKIGLTSGTPLVLIRSMEIAGPSQSKQGEPSSLTVDYLRSRSKLSTGAAAATASATPSSFVKNEPYQKPRNLPQPAAHVSITPITGLNPYMNKWTIKARVLSKGDMKKWSNPKGEGQLFSCTFSDASGEIRCTLFKDAALMYYDVLQQGSVYMVSKGQLKPANKQFNTTDNQYEMTLDSNSTIDLCQDSDDVPKIVFNAVPLNQLGEARIDSFVDVLGIVKEAGPLQDIMSKAQKPLKKRDVIIVDQSGFQVRMTMWGRDAEGFEERSVGGVIGVKGVKVGEYGGRSLSTGFNSAVFFNPDIPDAHRVKGWWDMVGHSQTFEIYSGEGGGGARNDVLKTIEAVSLEGLGQDPEKPSFFSLIATISHIKSENPWYAACRSDGCNKKVQELDNGWRCEKCEITHPEPQWRYIMSFAVQDYSGQMWLQVFNDAAEVLLGHIANDLHKMKTDDPGSYTKVFLNATGRTFQFKVRSKTEIYQDEAKVRHAATGVSKLDYAKQAHDLVELINSWKGVM